MSWKVMSSRLAWPSGTVLGSDELAGCNIVALVQGGHLAPVKAAEPSPDKPVPTPKSRSKRMPVEPVPVESADEPEEQE